MTSKHTPGPWYHSSGQIVREADGRTLALINYWDGSENQRADARLMTAAPDLYAALEALTDWAREHTSPRDPNSPHALLIEGMRALCAARED